MSDIAIRGRVSSAPGKAILCMLAGAALLTANDAVLKWMTGGYHTAQIMFCRGIFIAVPLALLAWRAGGWSALRPVNKKAHALRAAVVVTGTVLFVTGLKYLPLTDAIAITFAGPLFITALAPPLLGEHVGWRRWMAVSAGFIGILIIVRPGGGVFQFAALFALGASLTGACRDLLTRGLSAQESSVSLLATTSLGVVVAGGVVAPFVWTSVKPIDWAWFALGGLLIGAAHFMMIETYRYGQAALVAPFKYSGVIWAALFGYLIWGDVPEPGTVLGVSIVVAAGLYILHRERLKRGQP
ncbi:MAG: DMT family transporter [Rhodospirillaceae bacterium]